MPSEGSALRFERLEKVRMQCFSGLSQATVGLELAAELRGLMLGILAKDLVLEQ